MKAVALGLAFALACGGSALAAERAATQSPHCEGVASAKAKLKGAKFTVLTAGQFHFVEGVYVGSPLIPSLGLPPGDGALLVELDGHSGVVWTRGTAQICVTPIVFDIAHGLAAYGPMPVDAKLVDAIKTGKNEPVMSSGADELHL